eukprot:TRINITY_DN8011_c0_g1_i6.p1 TRINITY_DN8011_c0_g1~~TRINITY_DN8011_c0_g1_i6.p1  ORF type:complete len:185 (-),score=-9.02 TRINITY_DN8011_c0_g1_i6:562-1116(-)
MFIQFTQHTHKPLKFIFAFMVLYPCQKIPYYLQCADLYIQYNLDKSTLNQANHVFFQPTSNKKNVKVKYYNFSAFHQSSNNKLHKLKLKYLVEEKNNFEELLLILYLKEILISRLNKLSQDGLHTNFYSLPKKFCSLVKVCFRCPKRHQITVKNTICSFENASKYARRFFSFEVSFETVFNLVE